MPYQILSVIVLFLITTSCASVQKTAPVSESAIADLNPAFNAGEYRSSEDGVVILMDASSSMGESYDGYRKFDIAKAFVNRMNRTLPPISAITGLRTFGHAPQLSARNTELFYGMEGYDRSKLNQSLSDISVPGGPTPMADAIYAAGEDLKKIKGKKALVIVSDGKDLDQSPVIAARHLNTLFSENICIVTVLVGEDEEGRTLMENISSVSACGHTMAALKSDTSEPPARYVTDLRLKKAVVTTVEPKIPQKKEIGLGYHPPEPAIKKLEKIHFNFDDAALTKQAQLILDAHIQKLLDSPDVRIIIQGHASASGKKEYNQRLSEKRALSVKKYLETIGRIAPERLTIVGFGETKPFAIEPDPGKTDSPQARSNRRVVFELSD